MIKNPPLIKKVVEEMGGTFEEIIPERGCYNVHVKGKVFLITRKFRIAKNFISIAGATTHKDLTYTLLRRRFLPTPKTVFFFRKNLEIKDVKTKLACLKYPIIIKDSSGSNSRGIFPHIKTPGEAMRIIKKEILNFKSLIAQEMIFGREYRILILDDKVIGALEMIPPRVFGDGVSTIKKLIEKKQKSTHKKTPVDQTLKKILKEQGFSLGHILARGKVASIKKILLWQKEVKRAMLPIWLIKKLLLSAPVPQTPSVIIWLASILSAKTFQPTQRSKLSEF